MRRKNRTVFWFIIFLLLIGTFYFIKRLPECPRNLDENSLSLLKVLESENVVSQSWKIPEWVQRSNVTHLFDWTWHKNGDFIRCRTSKIRSPLSFACRTTLTTVVNDVLDYFRYYPDEGCIVDDVARLPNKSPHPLPRARSLSDTCAYLNINDQWVLCSKPQSELDNLLPSTKRFVTMAVFNAFVDTGTCHSQAPGTVFTERATFHLQRWTTERCANDPIRYIPEIKSEYQYTELINAIGNYFGAPGHFGPQQLPRLLRLIATTPSTAKVLVAKGGVADPMIDILVERGILSRDRIIEFDENDRPNYFANIVYYSDAWPYLKLNSHYLHDRTDMQLVHRVLASHNPVSSNERNRIIVIKRQDGDDRSIIEHSEVISYIWSALNQSQISTKFRIEIFDARGHIREHISLFRRARVIIGPHGAGMMNIMWAAPETHVVEVGYTIGMTFPEMYAEMSLHLDQHYWICKGYGDYTKPIHIDMADFSYIFNQIIRELENESNNF